MTIRGPKWDSLAKQIRGKNIVTLSLFDFMVTQKPEKYTSIKHMCFFHKNFCIHFALNVGVLKHIEQQNTRGKAKLYC